MTSEEIFSWLFAASVAMLLLSPLVVGWAVVRLPADYFVSRRRGHTPWQQTHPVLRLVVLVLKNMLGYVLLLAGIAMLVLPGQGLLTIVVGLALVDFPGKFRLIRWLVARKAVWRSIGWLRRRAGRPPLERPVKTQWERSTGH